MSNQGEDGYFPVCLVCGMGNVGCVVCLDPGCHEQREGVFIEGAREKYLDEAGHAWQFCHFCTGRVCSDGGAFGTYALCTDCWNLFAREGLLPPSSPEWLFEDIKTGVVSYKVVQRGLVRRDEVTVKGPRTW